MATRITPHLVMRHTHGVGEIAGAMIPDSSFIIRGKNTTISDIIRSSITAALDMRAAASTVVVKLTAAAIVEPPHLLAAMIFRHCRNWILGAQTGAGRKISAALSSVIRRREPV
jgi:hypothetical protein